MEKVIYWDVEENKIISEQEIRDLYFDLEINHALDNIEAFKDEILDLKAQLEQIRFAKYGDINDIIINLEMGWRIFIDKYKKEESK